MEKSFGRTFQIPIFNFSTFAGPVRFPNSLGNGK